MRIDRLDLVAYGHFTQCALALPRTDPDLVLLVGANEAGKSTARAAISDWLFGFEEQTKAGYLHTNPDLDVGGVLARGGDALRCHRRKKRKQSLLDGDGRPLPDDALAPYLAGVSRAAFESTYSLTDESLAHGVEAMLDAGDAAGDILQAARGIERLGGLRRTLQERLEALYAPKGSSKRKLDLAVAEHRDAADLHKAASRSWDQLRTLHAERTRLEARLRALHTQARTLEDTRARLERLLRAVEPARALRVATTAWRSLAEPTETERTQATRRAHVDALARRAVEVEALRQQVDEARRRFASELVAIRTTATELGLPCDDLETLRASLPTKTQRQALRALLDREAKAVRRVDECVVAQAERQAQRVAAEAELATATAAVGTANQALLEVLVSARETFGRVVRRAPEREAAARERRRRETRLDEALAAVGTGDDLPTLRRRVVPSAAEVTALVERTTACRRAAEVAAAALRDAEAAFAAARAEEARCEGGGTLVDAEVLDEARRRRDTRLDAAEASAARNEPLAALASLREARSEVVRTDALSDERFRGAEALGRLEQARSERSRAHARREAATEPAEAATEALAAVRDEVRRLATSLGLDTDEPTALTSYRERHAQALEAADALAQALSDEEIREAEERVVREALRERLRALGGDDVGSGASTDAELAQSATTLVATRRAALDARGERVRAVDRARSDLDRVEGELALARRELERVHAERSELVASLRLPEGGGGEALRASLDALDELDARLRAAEAGSEASLQVHLAAIERFERDATDAVEGVVARGSDERLRACLARAQRACANADAAVVAYDAARQKVTSLAGALASSGGLDPSDDAALAALADEALAEPPDALAAQLDATRAALDDAQSERDAAIEAQTRNEAEIGALGGDDAAASAESARFAARARIVSIADEVARLIAARELLDAAIERYRRDHQAPLLTRASHHLATLTEGRHARIEADADGGRVVLRTVRQDKRVELSGLSRGTRDQLYLALRLAVVEEQLDAGRVLPFVADDLFVQFDDGRSEAGFRVLDALAARTQVLYFTHHAHLVDVATRAIGRRPTVVELG